MKNSASCALRLALPLATLVWSLGAATGAMADDNNRSDSMVYSDNSPYQDLKKEHYADARDGFASYYKDHPEDPLVQLDLGLSYQKLGRMDLAEPLYREAMMTGTHLVPDVTTTDQSRGLTVAVIACNNLKYGLRDAGACGPKAPPPPPPVRNFIVFFDFDKSNLTEQAQQVVTEAVNAAKSGSITRVMIVGHTDTTGSHSYNQALSERRAGSVKNAMVSQGMMGADIATEGKSYDDPLVPTGPNVREPQNRRAVITLGDGAGT
jgi:outer membrane protein OmpA-like peptidoglycan-associated protein